MNCASVMEKFDDFKDGSMSERESSEFRRHISDCVECREGIAKFDDIDRELSGAFTGERPSADFAARTALASRDIIIASPGVRPVVWVALAAAACILIAALAHFSLPKGGLPVEQHFTETPVLAFMEGSADTGVGNSFVVSHDGRLVPYKGRTGIKAVWNFSDNALELTVDAFPGEE